MQEIIQFISSNPWFNVFTAVVALASAVSAVTPTPKEGSFLAKVYKIVDFCAINIGKAKQK